MATPPLPAGYSLDQPAATPPLPAGYSLDSSPAAAQPQVGSISAVPEPDSVGGKLSRWAQNVSDDIKYGTDITGAGAILKKMGARGVYAGNSSAVGDFMGSLPLGLARATKGAGEGPTWQGTKDVVGGLAQAATIPSSFIAPEAAETAASGATSLASKLNPGPMKEAAGGLLQSIAHDANKIPVQLENAGDAALKLMDWQKKTQLGPTINKFLNRITSPKLGPLTYEEGRDFYSLLGNMSADEKLKMPAVVKYSLQEMTSGLKTDLGNAAEQVGRAADYYKGLGDYAKAMRLQDWYEGAKAAAIGGLKYGIPAGMVGYGTKVGIDALTGK